MQAICVISLRLQQLISYKKRCNGLKDCEDGTDEVNCTCAEYLKNFYPDAVCDGVTDCADFSDEKNCGKLIKQVSLLQYKL